MKAPNARDITITAQTMYGEDRGDGLAGMVAVGWTGRNRANIAQREIRKQFGDGSLAAAFTAPDQFDCWNAMDPNYRKVISATMDDPSYQLAMLAALMVALDYAADPTKGATGYWADSIATPSWAEGKPFVTIGHQHYAAGV